MHSRLDGGGLRPAPTMAHMKHSRKTKEIGGRAGAAAVLLPAWGGMKLVSSTAGGLAPGMRWRNWDGAQPAAPWAQAELVLRLGRLSEQIREMDQVQQFSTYLHGCVNLGEARALLRRSLRELFPRTAGRLWEWNRARQRLEASAGWGAPTGAAVFAAEDCVALRRGKVHCGAAAGSSTCAHLAPEDACHSICVPLGAGGERLGVLSVRPEADAEGSGESRERRRAPRPETVAAVAGHIAVALANLHGRENLREQAVKDPLTGVFNRRQLETALPQEVRRAALGGSRLAVIVCDFDGFKEINDRCGHAAGDALLRAFGQVAAASVRPADVACRYGGDEFVLILPGATLAAAQRRAQALRQAWAKAVPRSAGLGGRAVTLSMGVSAFPEDGTSAECLLEAADAAMYRAKAAGGRLATSN